MFLKTIPRLGLLLATFILISLTTSSAQCDAVGGIITFSDGSSVQSIIVDGIPDPLDVIADGTQMGTNEGYVITDLDLNVLGLPPAPPFDLDGAGTGDCLIWLIRFENDLMGLAVGNNVSAVTGCFALSNPVTVERRLPTDVNGGNISFDDGSTSATICVDGVADPLDVITDMSTVVGETRAYVITDDLGNILGLPAAPPFNLDPAGPGTCLIWSLSFNGQITGLEVGSNASDLAGDFDLSNPLTVIRNEPNGGGISFTNGATNTTIIVDGTPDPLDVILDGTGVGSNRGWIITDDMQNILALPPAPPFDLDGAGVGDCSIYYIRYEDGTTGIAAGNNLSDLEGCFDLSNPLIVERKATTDVNGGNIEFVGGTTSETICVDGIADPLDVITDMSTVVGETRAYVITDDLGNILGLPAAPPFNLDPAGPGTCLIWSLSFNGQITGLEVGSNASGLAGDFDLSNPLTVIRNEPNGGGITLDDGSTSTTIIVDGVPDPLNVNLDGTGAGSNRGWIITDDLGNILALPPAPPFDLDGAGVGECSIYYIRYEDGTTGIMAGNNLTDLMGCFDLSNPIVVDRIAPTGVDGGTISFVDGSTMQTICVDGVADPLDVIVEAGTVVGENQAYVITDDLGNILGLPAAPPFDLDPAGPGTCNIYFLSFNGQITGLAAGENIADFGGDFDLSNPLTVVRNEPNGGGITLDDGSTSTTIIVDGVPDPLNVNLDGTGAGSNRGWIITDDLGNILALPPAPPFDLDGAGVGECSIYYIRYEDGTTGIMAGNNLTDLMGCFDLSNPIVVDRIAPTNPGSLASGSIQMPSGMTERTTCPGDDIDITVQLNYTITTGEVGYFLTDDDFTILSISASPMLSLTGAPPGECYIFAVNYTGDITVVPGDDFFNDDLTSGKDEASTNAIVVTRQNVEGGTILTQRGESTVYVCTGDDDFVGFRARGEEDNAEFIFVITDDNNNILGLNDDGFLNFGTVPEGVCRVWGLSYTGDITAQLGDNAAAVALSDQCFDLSDDFITVIRQGVEGGQVLTNGSERVITTVNNPVVNYTTTSTSTAAYAYFILGRDQRIAAVTFDQSFDFSTLPEERYFIYGISHNGNVLRGVGDSFFGRDITDQCFDRSVNAIVVTNGAAVNPFTFTASPVAEGQLSLKLATPVEDLSPERLILRITDAYGRVIFYEEGIDAASLESRVLQLSNAVPGVHFITIQQNDMLVTERVVMP
jgi:hypothetical protein